jgi:positive regulator of sigma E activity
MECRAEVVELDGRKALLRVARVNCAECGGCGMLSRDREQTQEFTVANSLGVRQGDEVILSVPSRKLYLAFLIMFGLPVLAIAAVYLLVEVLFGLMGWGSAQGPGVIAAVMVGFLAFWGGIKLADRLGLSPTMLQIVESGAAGESKE